MKYLITKSLACSNTVICSNTIVSKLETAFSAKLHANKKTDIVNGSVSILHQQNSHIIEVVFYETNENPNQQHKTIFKKLTTIPTKQQVISKI